MHSLDPSLIPTDNAEEALLFCRDLHAKALQAASSPTLSVVIPVFNEQESLPTLYERLVQELTGVNESFEILFVNDGSHDGSLELLSALVERDARVKVVNLSRNFGHQVAVSAGLDHSKGLGVLVMDADLQDPPEVLHSFIEKWKTGAEVVYAIRENRKEHPLKVFAYESFYRILQKMAHIDIPLDAGDFCLMDRKVVDHICRMPERNRFIRGIRSWVGFHQVGIPYERHARRAGDSKYSFKSLLSLAVDGILAFSHAPLRLATVMGLFTSGISFIFGIYFLARKLLIGEAPEGFASLIISMMFFFGVTLLTLGVIGEYVGRIFDEVKQRPLYIVQDVLEQPPV